MLHLRLRSLIPLLCFLVVPSLLAQTDTGMTATSLSSISTADQAALVAPTSSGATGLFNVITADTLRRGDWSFGVYYQNWGLDAAPAPFIIPSARAHKNMGYDLNRLSGSVGYGLTDNWEISGSLPYDVIKGNGGDRNGFINGFYYQGKFSDSGLAPLHLATKFSFGAPTATSKFAVSLFADLPTGSKNNGISSGATNFGAGLHYTAGQLTLGGSYTIAGSRSAKNSDFPILSPDSVSLPNEFQLEFGWNHPLHFWRTTNWISEASTTMYTGGDMKPQSPIILVTGLRHWIGDSGWSLNGGVRWNAAKYSRDHTECAITELDNCGLSALVGVTYAPLHLAAVAPPPPPPPPPTPEPPPPPPPTPVAPPEPPPVTPPHVPTELRTDEIHFESGSARLTNIAKAILDDVALRMKQEPTSTAIVIGYNDDKENTGPSQDLDRRRAEAVRDYLVSRHGIDPSRITVEGRDAREPASTDNTAEGRLRNRRVTIKLMLP
ncbi:MAG TPA: OmpA family protein [Thermoanaerobaculia bacterium]|nr:OmpA family protein [Thermoanaerobaculia bacterium]